MKSLKYKILFVILFMTIGIAAVTTNIIISGSTNIASNADDFDVYFSDVSTASMVDSYQIISSKNLTFNVALQNINQYSLFEFMVTNASKNYDADVSLTCNTESDYISIDYSMSNATISARSTEVGYVSVNLSKTYTGSDELNVEIYCSINASAVEKTTIVNDLVDSPVYYVGQEISVGSEKFNVISDNGDGTVTMLAQYNLGTDYKQNSVQNGVTFANTNGWEYTPGPKEINIQVYDGNVKTYVNEYVSYLKDESGDITLNGDLITVKQLGGLGCTIEDDYFIQSIDGCLNSGFSWLLNQQHWWTKSASSLTGKYDFAGEYVLTVANDGSLHSFQFQGSYGSLGGVRPVITISKVAVENDLILFTIDGVTYNAVNGMTWREWLNSTLNPDYAFAEYYDRVHYVMDGVNVSYNDEYVLLDYEIVEGASYGLK